MEKTHTLGKYISMDAEAYEKFVSLPKEKQIEQVYGMLSPKNMDLAVELLKHIPNGDNISKGGSKSSKEDNASDDSGASQKGSASRPSTDTGKGK